MLEVSQELDEIYQQTAAELRSFAEQDLKTLNDLAVELKVPYLEF